MKDVYLTKMERQGNEYMSERAGRRGGVEQREYLDREGWRHFCYNN